MGKMISRERERWRGKEGTWRERKEQQGERER